MSKDKMPRAKNTPPADDNKKNKRYNLRSKEETLRWVDDDTLFDDDDDDSTYDGSSSEEDTEVHGIKVPANLPVSVKIHLHTNVDTEEEYSDEEDYTSDEDTSDEEDNLQILAKLLGRGQSGGPVFFIKDNDGKNTRKNKKEEIPIKLSLRERAYFDDLTKTRQKAFVKQMKLVADIIGESEIPLKFRALSLNASPSVQAEIIRKVDMINRMGNDNGETQKLRNWVDGIMRVPFGKVIPLPVTMENGTEKCAEFLKTATKNLDMATYGMIPAKTQIMQILAQWVSNPSSVGNVIAMKGPMGTGKTSFARNGIAKVLERPFMFFSLGGATDIAHYTGHSYTYEGSTWGRIIDSIMRAGCMNPVLYFDELDKISGTPHGEEITSMLIHLTDRSQNSHFHDRYFAGIEFDLSQCLFVFSYNDESKIHPVLKDRLTTIQCSGYKEDEKKIIVANYIWPTILKNAGISREDLSATEEAAEYIIKEYSKEEEGMRNLIRIVEAVVSRINLIRLSDEESAKKYKFYVPIKFPVKLTPDIVKKILVDVSPKHDESWRSMYT